MAHIEKVVIDLGPGLLKGAASSFLARVICRIYVCDVERPVPIDLNDCLSFRNHVMTHALWHVRESADSKFLHRTRIHLISVAHEDRPLQNRQAFVHRMPVRRNRWLWQH